MKDLYYSVYSNIGSWKEVLEIIVRVWMSFFVAFEWGFYKRQSKKYQFFFMQEDPWIKQASIQRTVRPSTPHHPTHCSLTPCTNSLQSTRLSYVISHVCILYISSHHEQKHKLNNNATFHPSRLTSPTDLRITTRLQLEASLEPTYRQPSRPGYSR